MKRLKKGNKYLTGGIGNNTSLLKGTKHELCTCQNCRQTSSIISVAIGLPNPLESSNATEQPQTQQSE